MKRALMSACCVVPLVLSGMAEAGEKADDVPPVNESICSELAGNTPGLYGLCVAFHVGMACNPRLGASDPYADCKPGSEKVLAQYRKKMKTGDPDMPGIQEPCPCWSRVELLLLRRPTQDDATSCNIDKTSSAFANLDQWTVLQGAGGARLLTMVYTMEEDLAFGRTGSRCALSDGPQGVFRNFSITHEEFLACEPDVAWSAADRGISCVIHAELESEGAAPSPGPPGARR